MIGPPESLFLKSTKSWLTCYDSTAISPPHRDVSHVVDRFVCIVHRAFRYKPPV